VTSPNQDRIRELLRLLDAFERRETQPHEQSIVAIARAAIVDELARLSRADGLAVHRRGRTLDATQMVG
jgi:hypothetical protein